MLSSAASSVKLMLPAFSAMTMVYVPLPASVRPAWVKSVPIVAALSIVLSNSMLTVSMGWVPGLTFSVTCLSEAASLAVSEAAAKLTIGNAAAAILVTVMV